MTTTETEDKDRFKEGQGIPGVKAASIEDLPDDEKWQLDEGLRKQFEAEKEAYGKIGSDAIEESKNQIFDVNNPDEYFVNIGSKAYRFWAGFDTYYIEMSNGTVVKYTGLFPSVSEYEDIEDMRIEIIAGVTMDYQTDEKGKVTSGKEYNLIEKRNLEKLWLDKLADCYLLNTKTKKPMTHDERRNCKYQHILYGILKSKLRRSNNDNGPIGKN